MREGITRVFVYGSLLRGMGNHGFLERSRFVRSARTALGYRMYSLGAFPGVARDVGGQVLGEVFDVDGATLARLDRLEGHPHFYMRSVIALEDGERVETYLIPLETVAPHRAVVATGDWRAHCATLEEDRT